MGHNRDVVIEAKDRHKFVDDTEKNQRERERDDLSFQVPENHWSTAARTARAFASTGSRT